VPEGGKNRKSNEENIENNPTPFSVVSWLGIPVKSKPEI